MIVWLNNHPDRYDAGEHWDQADVRRLFAHLDGHPVYVVAGRFHATPDDVKWVRDQLTYPCVLVVTSDEESLFPWWEFTGQPDVKVWVMTPRPGHLDEHGNPDVILGEGLPPDARDYLRNVAGYTPWRYRKFDWVFAGQDGHARRDEAIARMEALPQGHLLVSKGFNSGTGPDDYYSLLGDARCAPAPSGPATPDSFRAFEAFAAGCVPMLDAHCTAYADGSYWYRLFDQFVHDYGPRCGHLVVHDWRNLRGYIEESMHTGSPVEWGCPPWVETGAWWSQYQRWLRRKALEHTEAFGSATTVIVTTSPIPSHPSVAMLRETIDSIQHRLPLAEIIVAADGVREEQTHLADAYMDYLHHVAWLCNTTWRNVCLVTMPGHRHQALTLKRAMELVDTPYVFVSEHDTPLQGEIDMLGCENVLQAGYGDMIRFIHESRVLDDYEHLMLGGPEERCGVKLRATMQWSQRPHLATAAFYRRVLSTYFGDDSRTMVEDVMYGVIKNLVEADFNNWLSGFRLWVYHEPDDHGSIQRSYHLDGRGDEPMFDNVFAYNGGTPDGAPAPTAGRTD